MVHLNIAVQSLGHCDSGRFCERAIVNNQASDSKQCPNDVSATSSQHPGDIAVTLANVNGIGH